MTRRRSAPSSPKPTRNTKPITRSISSTPPTMPASKLRRPGRSVSRNPTSPARQRGGSSAVDDSAGPIVRGREHLSGPLGSANREIREAERRDQQRRLARIAEPRRLTDRLLGQLEELNLDGVGTVPDGYEPALAELRDQLEGLARVRPRLIEQLQPGTRTAELIDVVFIIQEIIAPPRLPSGSVAFDDTDV